MELTAGYPFWMMKDGLPFQYPALSMDINTEVAIIGGGISGSLMASVLTNAGIGCVVVDGRTIGYGSTAASTSLLQYELDTPLYKLEKKIGTEKAGTVYRLCAAAIDEIIDLAVSIGYTEYDKQKSLFYSLTKGDNSIVQKEFEARKKAGFDVLLLDKTEILELYGCTANSGILSMQGATINAYTFTHALLQHVVNKTGKVFDRTKVVQINENKLVTEKGFNIKAKHIINATGFEVVDFINKDIVKFYATYAFVSEQLEERDLWANNSMLWSTGDPYLYVRTTKDNRVIVGGRDERFSTKITREAYLEDKSIKLLADFENLFPSIKLKKEFSWSGTFGKTKDSLPYIGKLNGTYYALGFGGNGITFSMLAAKIICDLISGKANSYAKLFSFDR